MVQPVISAPSSTAASPTPDPLPGADATDALADLPRLLIIDDHLLVRLGVQTLVAQHFEGRLVIEEAGTLEQGLALLQRARAQIVLVVLDLQLPDAKGFAGLQIVRRDHPELPLVVLSGAQDARVREEALRLGATAYVSKTADAGQMQALVEVLRRQLQNPATTVTPAVRPAVALQAAEGLGLSPRQVQVLELLLAGLDNQAIAGETGLTLGTVKNCVSSVFLGFNVRSRAELVGLFPN
jgi:DNA-binding NarL/FixJ family response regulator